MSNQFMVIQNDWAIIAIAVGIALVLFVSASYLVVWLPRFDKSHWVTQNSRWRDVFGSIPWPLLYIYLFITIMTIATIVFYMFNIPNW